MKAIFSHDISLSQSNDILVSSIVSWSKHVAISSISFCTSFIAFRHSSFWVLSNSSSSFFKLDIFLI